MTWLSFCARRPGPEWKTGYGTGDRTLAQIEGVVDHSMAGSLAGAYSVLDGSRQASWTFSIPKVGEPVQHYSLEKIPWHAGIMGDRKQDTSLIGNLTLGGKEHEGVTGEAWTENQLHWSAKIDVALRVLCPTFGANPPTMRVNIFWHTWLSATSCPSGRNPDEEKIAFINELEEDMAWSDIDKQYLNDRLEERFRDLLTRLPDKQYLNDRLAERFRAFLEALPAGTTPTVEEMIAAFEESQRKAWGS